MRRISLIVFSTPVLLVCCFAEDGPATWGSIRGEVITKTQNGEPAVLPDAHIVLHGPVNKETQSDARGAFTIDSLPPGTYDIDASAPGLNTTVTVEVNPGTATVVPIELSMATVASTVTVTAPLPRSIGRSCSSEQILQLEEGRSPFFELGGVWNFEQAIRLGKSICHVVHPPAANWFDSAAVPTPPRTRLAAYSIQALKTPIASSATRQGRLCDVPAGDQHPNGTVLERPIWRGAIGKHLAHDKCVSPWRTRPGWPLATDQV